MNNESITLNSPRNNAPTPRTKLRGWFHALFVPFVIASCIVLICLAPGAANKGAAVVFMLCSLMLFVMSGVYHIFNWKPNIKGILRRFDHMNIFLIIAGTYTPITVGCLPLVLQGGLWDSGSGGTSESASEVIREIAWYQSGTLLLILIWTLTLIGLILHLIWISAPRVLYTVIYIVLGLTSVIWLPAITEFGTYGIAITSLVSAGGILYITGAIFYAIKNPLRNAKVFGFHELFHCCTILAFICHTVAIYLSALG